MPVHGLTEIQLSVSMTPFRHSFQSDVCCHCSMQLPSWFTWGDKMPTSCSPMWSFFNVLHVGDEDWIVCPAYPTLHSWKQYLKKQNTNGTSSNLGIKSTDPVSTPLFHFRTCVVFCGTLPSIFVTSQFLMWLTCSLTFLGCLFFYNFIHIIFYRGDMIQYTAFRMGLVTNRSFPSACHIRNTYYRTLCMCVCVCGSR